MYYFLEADLQALNAQIAEVVKRLRDIGQEMGDAVGQSSESWHDNFGHEDATRQYGMWSERLRELSAIRDNAQVIVPVAAPHTVVIGSKVTYVDAEGEKKTVQIGSYRVPDGKQDVSYISPIARILMGGRVGEEVTGKLVGKEVAFEIVQIDPYA